MVAASRARGRHRWGVLVGVIAVAVLAAACVPQGTHTVSSFGEGGISPGLWRTLGGNDCHWTRRSTGGGTLSSVRSFGGPRYVDVEASDGSFEQTGCVTFWGEPGPFAKALHNPSDALAPFGPGDWMAGYEIAPGWYAGQGAPSGGECVWRRLSGWHHTNGEVIASGKAGAGVPQLVQLGGSDEGFTSDGCGLWRRVYVPPTSTGSLVDSWKATSVRADNGALWAVPADDEITATFGSDGRLTGFDACNDYEARFVAEGGKLALGRIGLDAPVQTCSWAPGSSPAPFYGAALEAAVAYLVTGGALTLFDGNGAPVALFQAA